MLLPPPLRRMEYLFSCIAVLILVFEIQGCWSLNSEGLMLLEFRANVNSDPYGAFLNWNGNDSNPCVWTGVFCVGGEVQMLDLHGMHLEGTLVPELGKLIHLVSLILSKNRFVGAIPKEIGGLAMLELLDLRENNLDEKLPAELGGLFSLKRLLISDNKFEGSIPLEFGNLNSLAEFQFDENLISAAETWLDCVNRKFGHCIWQSTLSHPNMADSLIPIKGALKRHNLFSRFKFGKDSLHDHGKNYVARSSEQYIFQNIQSESTFARRRLLEQSSNLEASPAPDYIPSSRPNGNAPIFRSSGSFLAIPISTKQQQSPAPTPPLETSPNKTLAGLPPRRSESVSSKNIWNYALIGAGVAVLFIVVVAMIFMCRRRGVIAIVPWKTGLSGQLQKAFVTGVPKLNRPELETACEDFSNIIDTFDECTIYKGTLSSGVEIAVASTTVPSAKEWSKSSEIIYRKKIDTMSRLNHKNFINLLGFCEEDEPFLRMMVFEYASNGSLFEHLHVKEVEHLDWSTRVRVIMGTAYCLQHMHHDMNPPVSHPNLISATIFLTDDYAAKIADFSFWKEAKAKSNFIGKNNDSVHSELPMLADPETNVYSFGLLLLEIISGKLPFSEEQGSLTDWAHEHLNDRRSMSYLIDPTLKSFKDNELDIICDVISDCIQSDPRQRPTMKEVTSKLRQVIAITPDAATPRLSPLWWAELEILSVEAS